LELRHWKTAFVPAASGNQSVSAGRGSGVRFVCSSSAVVISPPVWRNVIDTGPTP
jgi:hypothetical protein